MNFLKPIIIATFAFFALSLNAQIQEAPASSTAIELFSQDNLDLLTTELSLSQDQVAKIEGLNSKVIQKLEAIHNDSEMDASRKKEFIEGNKEDHKRVMSTILTNDQFASYLDLMKAKATSGESVEPIKSKEIKKTY